MAAETTTRTRITPTQIARETFLVHDHHGEGTEPVAVALNSMVIRARQPVVVDAGMQENTEQYLSDVFSLVDPEDVRWVFISHDDVDHTGALNALMAACPNAVAVINWFMVERMGASLDVHPTRWLWVADGESFDVGDRVLHAVRPPVFDAGTTRGLFDPSTGVYWGSDSFATPMLTPVPTVDPIDHDMWSEGMKTFSQYISPWIPLTEAAAFDATVTRVERLGVTALAGCHTPAIQGRRVKEAFDITRASRTAVVPPQPDQSILEQIQATFQVVTA
jgi:flavorubredoxin